MGKSDEEILLSVVLPVYNVADYLERCLDSILAQTYPIDEIICVDDGSTDTSLEILKRYEEKYPNIKVVHKENGGLVSARKAGADIAGGKYISCIDSDDWIENNMYQEMMDLALEYDADIVSSGCIRDYGDYCLEDNENIKAGFYYGESVKALKANMVSTDKFYESNLSVHIWGKLYKRVLYNKYQYAVSNEVNVGEDAAVVYPCILDAEKIYVTGKNYYHYCMRNNSIMGIVKKEEHKSIDIALAHIWSEFSKKETEINNLIDQFQFIKCNYYLMRNPDKILEYKNGVLFPFGEIERNQSIVLYGKGRIGVMLKHWLDKENCCKVSEWIDKKSHSREEIMALLSDERCDKVIIAVGVHNVVKDIIKELTDMGIDSEKICTINCELIKKWNV